MPVGVLFEVAGRSCRTGRVALRTRRCHRRTLRLLARRRDRVLRDPHVAGVLPCAAGVGRGRVLRLPPPMWWAFACDAHVACLHAPGRLLDRDRAELARRREQRRWPWPGGRMSRPRRRPPGAPRNSAARAVAQHRAATGAGPAAVRCMSRHRDSVLTNRRLADRPPADDRHAGDRGNDRDAGQPDGGPDARVLLTALAHARTPLSVEDLRASSRVATGSGRGCAGLRPRTPRIGRADGAAAGPTGDLHPHAPARHSGGRAAAGDPVHHQLEQQHPRRGRSGRPARSAGLRARPALRHLATRTRTGMPKRRSNRPGSSTATTARATSTSAMTSSTACVTATTPPSPTSAASTDH